MNHRQSHNSPYHEARVRYTVESVSTEEGLSALEADWNRLSETSDHPNAFMTYGWYRAWTTRLGKEHPRGRFLPHVLVLKEAKTVVGIAPLVRRIASRFFRVRKIEFSTVHADYNDLILGSDPVGQTSAVVDYLARTADQWDIVDLRDLRDTGERVSLIESAMLHTGLPYHFFPEQGSCPYLSIEGHASEIIKRHSRRVRHTLRNQRARALAQGLRTRTVENPAQEPDLLKKLIALDDKKHLQSGCASFVGKFADVFQSLFYSLGPRGWLYVALLEQGEQPVAFQFGFRCGGKLWDYAKAFDGSFFRLSPGTLLLQAVLDFGFELGYSEYDFLRGEEPYKSVWGTGTHRRFRLLIWNRRKMSRTRKFVYHDVGAAIRRLLANRI